MVKKRKLRWFGQDSRSSGFTKLILQGTVNENEEEIDRRRGGKAVLKGEQGWILPV